MATEWCPTTSTWYVASIRLSTNSILIQYLKIRAERKQYQPEKEGRVPGDVEAIPAPDDADKYVIIKKKDEGKDQDGEKQNEKKQ